MTRVVLALSVGTALALTGCSGGGHDLPTASARSSITVRSPAFSNGGSIPVRFTCDGKNESPEIVWSGASEHGSLVLVMTDLDADGFVHWLVYNLGGFQGTVGGGSSTGGEEGKNDFGDTGYGGPCPPVGSGPHRYVIHLYEFAARPSPFAPGETPEDVLAGTPIAQGVLTGTYERA